MFKQILAYLCLSVCSHSVFADKYLQIGVGQDFSASDGQISDNYTVYDGATYQQKDRQVFFVDWQHQKSFLPNIKFQYNQQQDALFFEAQREDRIGDLAVYAGELIAITSKGGRYDLSFYYNIIDKRADLNVGINYSYFLIDSDIENITNNQQTTQYFSEKMPLPSVYVGFGFDLVDNWKIAIDAKIHYLILYFAIDLTAGVHYQLTQHLGGEIGYRYDNLQDYLGFDDARTLQNEYHGLFAGLVYQF